MTVQLLVLVVVYRRDLNQSETLVSLAACRHLLRGSQVLVWDNSPLCASPEQCQWLEESLPGSEYHHDPTNPGLATVYNRVILSHLKSGAGKLPDYLVLFDHDSWFGPDFFEEIERARARYRVIPLFLPIVIANGVIVSPAHLRGFKGSLWKEKKTGLIGARHCTAINSGMVISADYLKQQFTGYDERLRFYGTDNYFMQNYATRNSSLVVLDCVVHHDLARYADESVELKLSRHRESVESIRIMNEGQGFYSALANLYCWVYGVRQAIKNRDTRFLV